MTAREIAERDALERWNVGYAREWSGEIVTADHVAAADLTSGARLSRL